MTVRVRDLLQRELGELRYEPIDKRIRGEADGQVVVDSRRALLIWEPRRIAPHYGFPAEDVTGELAPSTPPSVEPELAGRPVLSPAVPFAAHTADGEPVAIRVPDSGR